MEIGNNANNQDVEVVELTTYTQSLFSYDSANTNYSFQLDAEKSAFGKIRFYKAYQIAKENAPSVNQFFELKNGYFFINDQELNSASNLGLAIFKKYGKVYWGIAAHDFLEGDIIKEGSL